MTISLRYSCYLLSIFLVATYGWLRTVFGNRLTVEQIFFHLDLGLNNLTGIDMFLIIDAIKWVLIPTAAIGTALFLIGKILDKASPFIFNITRNSKPIVKKSWKAITWFYLGITGVKFSIFLALFTSILFLKQIEFFHFVSINLGEDYFTARYVKPDLEKLTSQKTKKNLLLIYVESLERTMGNVSLVGKDTIAPIKKLDGLEITSFPAAPGTNWTIAGMLSSQCSIPLKPFFANKFSNLATNDFFPNATCLGDVLKTAGYEQYFLVGHHPAYSGLDKFYRTHGYQHILGRDDWKARGVDLSEFDSWGFGLHDDVLLEQAHKVIKEHDRKKSLFNLTLITQDNHFPKGIPSPRCTEDEKKGDFVGTFHCNSRFLADFVTNLKREGLLENTVVILMGDHPFMNSMKQQALYFREDRNVYFKILSPLERPPSRQTMTHFDVAPSILDLLGLTSVTDTRFGLGISLFSSIPSTSYTEHQKAVLSDSILNKSLTYDAFWLPKQK